VPVTILEEKDKLQAMIRKMYCQLPERKVKNKKEK